MTDDRVQNFAEMISIYCSTSYKGETLTFDRYSTQPTLSIIIYPISWSDNIELFRSLQTRSEGTLYKLYKKPVESFSEVQDNTEITSPKDLTTRNIVYEFTTLSNDTEVKNWVSKILNCSSSEVEIIKKN